MRVQACGASTWRHRLPIWRKTAHLDCPKRLYLDNGSEYQWTNMIDGWAELAALTHGAFGGAWGMGVS